ncbi:hypothetical protein JCM8547_003066 [Rhodosporidiobolus lusitaniae]
MTTVAAIPISPLDGRYIPVLSTIDSPFSPSGLHLQPYTCGLPASPSSINSASQVPFGSPSPSPSPSAVPMGTRFERPPYDGPGTAIYVRQPTRAQLRENNFVFGSPNRPYYYKDPENKPFIDADGKECGDRWIYIDPKAKRDGESDDERGGKTGCCVM